MISLSKHPKISIVTPSFNQAAYLEQTILSVLDQNYPNLEYFIIDGGSTDDSVDIIQKYSDRLTYWTSEPDTGMYHALQKGMARTTGDIMGWLNSDDMLHKNALYNVAEILSLPGVNWIQGQPSHFDEQGRTVNVFPSAPWSKYRYLMQDYEWIQQESTYWTRDLWESAGGYISTEYKYAGDMELWNRFFRHEKLYTPACLIGGFRVRQKEQASLEGMDTYRQEAISIHNANVPSVVEQQTLKKIKNVNNKLRWVYRSRLLALPLITARLQHQKNQLLDFPASIQFDRKKQKYCLTS